MSYRWMIYQCYFRSYRVRVMVTCLVPRASRRNLNDIYVSFVLQPFPSWLFDLILSSLRAPLAVYTVLRIHAVIVKKSQAHILSAINLFCLFFWYLVWTNKNRILTYKNRRIDERTARLRSVSAVGLISVLYFRLTSTYEGVFFNDASRLIVARSETVCAGMVYRHFSGRLEIIPPLLSGRWPYRYGKPLKLLRPDAFPRRKICSMRLRPGFRPGPRRGAYSAPPYP